MWSMIWSIAMTYKAYAQVTFTVKREFRQKKKLLCCPLPTDRKMRKKQGRFFFFFFFLMSDLGEEFAKICIQWLKKALA